MIEYEKRAMIEPEDKYSFSQSSQISSQTSLIGYLRADMDTDGNGFFSSWNDFRSDLKTDEFKTEFDSVINSLREEGDILHNRQALSHYCYSNPQSRMNTEQDYFGVRIDTKKYAYLLRLNPNKGEYNLYCYCYVKDWLDDHIKQARHGIRFITPDYEERFRIPDGDKIRITLSDGEQFDRVCRYIDDYHLEVGDVCFHICEFAERMQQSEALVIPLRSSLPKQCYVFIQTENKVGIVKRGENGYYPTDIIGGKPSETKALVEESNRKLGVTKAQAEAMKCGSMFGWDTPAADPKNYDHNGNPIKEKKNKELER